MKFQDMISKSPAEAAEIADEDILRESYPIEYYEPTIEELDTYCVLRSRLRTLEQGKTPQLTAQGRVLCEAPDPDEMKW